jgi:hypothetical protein
VKLIKTQKTIQNNNNNHLNVYTDKEEEAHAVLYVNSLFVYLKKPPNATTTTTTTTIVMFALCHCVVVQVFLLFFHCFRFFSINVWKKQISNIFPLLPF